MDELLGLSLNECVFVWGIPLIKNFIIKKGSEKSFVLKLLQNIYWFNLNYILRLHYKIFRFIINQAADIIRNIVWKMSQK